MPRLVNHSFKCAFNQPNALSSYTQAVRNIVHTSNHGIILELVKFRHHLGDLETARQAIEETFLDFATTLRNNS